MIATKRTSVVLNALVALCKSFESLPESPATHALRLRALACEVETKRWPATPPSAEGREAMMKRVLEIHVALARLVREDAARG